MVFWYADFFYVNFGRALTDGFADDSSERRAAMRDDLRAVARVITSFARCLTPVEKLSLRASATSVSAKEIDTTALDILCCHALAHSAMATLHGIGSASGDTTAINASLVHATEVLKIIEKVCDVKAKLQCIPPIFAVSHYFGLFWSLMDR